MITAEHQTAPVEMEEMEVLPVPETRWRQEWNREQAAEYLLFLLRDAGRKIVHVLYDNDNVEILVQEIDHNVRTWRLNGPLNEMGKCLLVSWYWYDGKCVMPPEFISLGHEQDVLGRVKENVPLRDAIGRLLPTVGLLPVEIKGLHSERGCVPMWIATMLMAGITDPAILKAGVLMDLMKLTQICEWISRFGIPFEVACKLSK